jgi:ABC-2 type transport system permease protein
MKHLAIAALAARHALHARGEAVARAVFYVAILVVLASLWKALGAGASYVWYVALTEWIVLAMPLLSVDIEDDVRKGDIAYRIARPVSYLWAKVADGLGNGLTRLLMIGGVGGIAAWALTGTPPPRGILLALPLATLSFLLLVLWQAALGLLAFWIGDTQPLFWVWQKLLFLLGGLLFPLEVYPEWLQRAAYCTPFAPMLHGWARLAFDPDPALAAQAALLLAAWGVALLAFLAWLYRRALVVLDVNGG